MQLLSFIGVADPVHCSTLIAGLTVPILLQLGYQPVGLFLCIRLTSQHES